MRASLMRCCNSSPLIPLNEFDALPEIEIDSVALLGSIPGTGMPEGTTSLLGAPVVSCPVVFAESRDSEIHVGEAICPGGLLG
jgi:hypothetical protein